MSVIEKLYKKGLNLSQVLVFVDDEAAKISGKKCIDTIQEYRNKVADELAFFRNYGATSEDKVVFNQIIEPYQETITKLEQILLDGFYSYMKAGTFIAFGYSSIDNHYPVLIRPNEWNFLEIDKEKNIAYCEERKYRAIKFVLATELKQLSDSEFKDFIELYKPKVEAVENNTDVETQKPQIERQSQLYILIWRVHQFLSQTKKPTAQQVWNEIQQRYKDYDTDEIIQEVDSSKISWCSGYGNEQTLQRSSFDKTLSKIRNHSHF